MDTSNLVSEAQHDRLYQDAFARYDVAVGQPSVGPDYHADVDHSEGSWTLGMVAAGKGRISRVRWLSEGRYCDLSYIHATLPDGRIVPVQVDGGIGVPTAKRMVYLLNWARREQVYGHGIGLLNRSVWSTL